MITHIIVVKVSNMLFTKTKDNMKFTNIFCSTLFFSLLCFFLFFLQINAAIILTYPVATFQYNPVGTWKKENKYIIETASNL